MAEGTQTQSRLGSEGKQEVRPVRYKRKNKDTAENEH